jgi:hypothetical protein
LAGQIDRSRYCGSERAVAPASLGNQLWQAREFADSEVNYEASC